MNKIVVGLVFASFRTWICSLAYSPGYLHHRQLAGLWKLTQTKRKPPPVYYPMKEFTVYPKDKEKRQRQLQQELQEREQDEKKEMLLMLKEDGSFQQYADDDASEDDDVKIPDKLKYHNDDEAVLERFFGKIQGTWDYKEGTLILAADRPHNNPGIEDTLLVGEVVATSEESLDGNPVLRNSNETNAKAQGAMDTHLSVPKGEVKVGKFFYPKNHPSFFDQPMFQPVRKGKFQLRQVLGSLNARNWKEEAKLVEKFRAKDFYGKRFLLTSHPLGERKPKGNVRWSIKYNRYVGE